MYDVANYCSMVRYGAKEVFVLEMVFVVLWAAKPKSAVSRVRNITRSMLALYDRRSVN